MFPVTGITASYQLDAEQLHFRRLSVRDGLPSAYINVLLQRRDGFIWLGTKGGLARFDGLRFVHYPLSEHTGLGSNDILSLLEDRQQRFWVGTEKGLYLFDQTLELFALQSLPKPEATILTLHQDAEQGLWVGTDVGLYLLADGQSEFTLILPEVEVKFLAEQAGNLWIGTKQGLYYRQQQQTPVFIDLMQQPGFDVRHQRIFDGILVGEKLYLATQRDGLLVLDTHSKQLDQQLLTADRLASNSIWSLALSNNELWLGYFYDGIAVLSLPDHSIRHYSHHPQIQYSIPHNNISQLLFDQAEQLWVATTNGLAVANPVDAAIVHLGEYQNITNKHVWSVAATEQEVWFGTESGLNHFDRSSQQLTTFPASGEAGTLPRTVIWSLLPWQEQVLLGTNVGLLGFDPGSAQVETLIAEREVYSLRQDQQHLLIGFYDGGFAVMDLADRTLLMEHPPISRGYITDIQPVAQGYLLASSSGLWLVQQGEAVELAEQLGITELKQRHITSLLLDADRLWLATQDHGLFVLAWQQAQQQWQLQHHLTVEQGLAENQLRGLAKDENGDIWLTGMRTLSRIEPQTLTITALSRHLHWLDMEFHANAVSRTKASELAFGGNQGLLLFAPDRLTANADFPRLHLTSVQLMAQSQPAFIEQLTIQPDQSYYAFEFAALEFLSPERIHYQYRLQPLVNSWRAMAGNQLSLSQLPYGQYELEVRSTNADGIWNPDSKRIQLNVISPWWRTWQAKLSYLLGALLLLSYSALLQLKRNRKLSYIANHDNLTKLANRRFFTKELEQRLQLARKHQHRLALMYFDLNKFKELNDTHGHDAGDQLLVETAMKLQQASRSTDFAARLGGDEFVLILDRIKSDDELEKAVARLSKALNTSGQHYARQAIDVSCSIGVALFSPQQPVSASTLLKQADTAMYQSKTEQRPWCLYHSKMKV
ncbi:diguanylate cyclase [Alkalimonas sp.]|uniref:diguanylate cyclase domain-containing protein n=1 Tax=Alkalimonas sp. TaxID=1872453 RepID=UPI002A1D5235|nr:diguanylate cyclase [Alkalimonas sp.]